MPSLPGLEPNFFQAIKFNIIYAHTLMETKLVDREKQPWVATQPDKSLLAQTEKTPNPLPSKSASTTSSPEQLFYCIQTPVHAIT
jgi:hypothetical protein